MHRRINRSALATSAAAVVLAFATTSAWSATVPYNQSFDTDPGWTSAIAAGTADSANTYAQAQSGQWGMKLTRSSGSSITQMSSVSVTGLNSGDFDMSAVLTPASSTDGFNTSIGLRFLAASATSDNDSYVADLNIGSLNPGRLRLVEFTGSTATIYPSSTQTSQGLVSNFSRTGTYLLDVTGQYSAGALTLDFKVTDQSNPANFGEVTNLFLNGAIVAPDGTPRTGDFFGFRNGIGSSGAAQDTVALDNFSVASTPAPEPGMIALLLPASLVVLLRRRSRQ